MTNEDIKAARAIIEAAEAVKYHLGFPLDTDPTAIYMRAARTGWPEALDEIERLHRVENNAEREMAKLKAVAEAAEPLLGEGIDHGYTGTERWRNSFWKKLDAAIKAWRGE